MSRLVLPLLAGLALVSCVATGTKVTEEQLFTFQRGHTTYFDVVARLGKPTQTTLLHDGTRQAVYVYTQAQLKPENFIPLVAMFTQGATSETTMVTLDFDARAILTGYTASQGQATTGTGFQSGAKQ